MEIADRPIILAGGLTPENVKSAIVEVQPAGVDSHTGVEDSSGRKSREKVQKFLSEAMKLLRSLKQSSNDHEVRVNLLLKVRSQSFIEVRAAIISSRTKLQLGEFFAIINQQQKI